MSAYTEKNFDACLDAIGIIKRQRDSAIRIADALIRIEIVDRGYHDSMCDCEVCLLGKSLSQLKTDVAVYHTRKDSK